LQSIFSLLGLPNPPAVTISDLSRNLEPRFAASLLTSSMRWNLPKLLAVFVLFHSHQSFDSWYTHLVLTQLPSWPYLPTLARLGLALAIGLFVGIERERRYKEAGLRTFAFVAVLGAVGGLLGESFSLLALGLVGVLVVFLNIETIRTQEGAEITTSAALFVTSFAGILAGQGHTFTPSALGIATAALLAWKEPLAGSAMR
jgi:hypothetical protein